MNYKEVCKYIDDTLIFGIKPNLLRINKILNLLDNPEKKINFIHVVGTNGKTSVTKITAAILNSHGFKAGYYISPSKAAALYNLCKAHRCYGTRPMYQYNFPPANPKDCNKWTY